MLNRVFVFLSPVAAIILLVMMHFTTPTQVGPLGVLVFFTIFYVLMFSVALLLVQLINWLLGRKTLITQKSYFYAAVMAFGPIMLLLLQSFGMMNWGTFTLTVVFVMIASFLVNKRV